MALAETNQWLAQYEDEMAAQDPLVELANFIEWDSLYRHEDCEKKQGVFDPDPQRGQALLHERATEFLAAVEAEEADQAKHLGRAGLKLVSQS